MGEANSSCRKMEVRIGHSLNKEEEEFVAMRRKTVQQSLQKHFWFDLNEVPNIALLGSGGGERAMVGLLGSLDQLQKTGLLDCVLYLCGVSGSTWCMASLYQEPDWSTKLETVKDEIIRRLSGPAVDWGDAFAKLKKYYKEKDIFSLTDFWAAMVVTTYVKEIDEHTLSDQWDKQSKDPFPIYTVIDKQCKQSREGDPWFEFTPYEAGYSLTGVFVETSKFGSKFENGCKIKDQPEIDMLYLQALSGSAAADGDEIKKVLWEQAKDFLTQYKVMSSSSSGQRTGKDLFSFKDPHSLSADECDQVLMNLVDLNIAVLNGKDPYALDKSIRTKLNEFSGGKSQLQKLDLFDKEATSLNMMSYTTDVLNSWCSNITNWEPIASATLPMKIMSCVNHWTWGRNYNFLYNMKVLSDEAVPTALLESETRDYIDAGLLLNSPYFSVLRQERDIDLIISLDFSDGDPFKTVKEVAEMCMKLKIPFPEVKIPSEEVKKPKDFYVFKGQNTPTVIHMPLFNVVNCGDKIEEWRNKYKTFQGPYSAEMITDLMEVAGKNITNNRAKLLKEISVVAIEKWLKELITLFDRIVNDVSSSSCSTQ